MNLSSYVLKRSGPVAEYGVLLVSGEREPAPLDLAVLRTSRKRVDSTAR